jgi:hypothetical protein
MREEKYGLGGALTGTSRPNLETVPLACAAELRFDRLTVVYQ